MKKMFSSSQALVAKYYKTDLVILSYSTTKFLKKVRGIKKKRKMEKTFFGLY